jgi:hypothetical protein
MTPKQEKSGMAIKNHCNTLPFLVKKNSEINIIKS